jgi:macrodomain Ter protein organizer (MatP/YcbG family)
LEKERMKNIALQKEVHTKLKILCAQESKTMTQVIESLIDFMEKHNEQCSDSNKCSKENGNQ